jgi:hypothetical protein
MQDIAKQKKALKLMERAGILLSTEPIDRIGLVTTMAEVQHNIDYQARLEAEQKRLPRGPVMKGFTL